eukprot:1565129-Pyramimonas_sp.AAC.1
MAGTVELLVITFIALLPLPRPAAIWCNAGPRGVVRGPALLQMAAGRSNAMNVVVINVMVGTVPY